MVRLKLKKKDSRNDVPLNAKSVYMSMERADFQHPDRLFGVMNVNGGWVFGEYVKSEAVWFRHQKKPNGYSTALNTRVARAVVNIAIPNPNGIKAIDPCCGIGTVLVEARSMGIDMVGSDRNQLILPGARENMVTLVLLVK